MQTQTATQEWVKLPTELYVSDERIEKQGYILTFDDLASMDIGTFNKEAKNYDVQIEDTDPLIDRLIKYSIFLSRKSGDNSFIPTNRQYVDMLIDTANAEYKKEEPLASFYETLVDDPFKPSDAVKEILEFQEKLPNGKYKTTLLRFNEDGELEQVDEIDVAGEGYIRVLGVKHGYPIETSKERGSVENIEIPLLKTSPLEQSSLESRWYIGLEPKRGEQRLVIHHPWNDPDAFSFKWNIRLFDTDVNLDRRHSDSYESYQTHVSAIRMRKSTSY